MNRNFYKNKKILITGCTGFTGSWLILYFKLHGAKIYGYSKKPPFKNSLFQALNLKKKISFLEGDIKDLKKFSKFYQKSNPDYIFHLAANPIVKECHYNPVDAYNTNTIGTLNLLETIRNLKIKKKISLNIITTDKVYKNSNKKIKFHEDNILGGDDPYSSSKVCAELICETYFKTYFKKKKINMNMMRSGNIIGGGDWSKYRLMPDIINSYKKNKMLILRNPKHTRPWQHIFDVINSYALIAKKVHLKNINKFFTWNIGPLKEKEFSVDKIVKIISIKLSKKIKVKIKKENILEKKNLQLNSNKVYKKLKIKNKINTINAIKLTIDWYSNYYKNKDFSKQQLKNYLNDKY